MDILLKIAQIISAFILAAGAAFATSGKFRKWFLSDIQEQIENVSGELKQIKLQQYKLILCNTSLSIHERLSAGEAYLANGGNGLAKKYYEKLLNEEK
jgi:nitrogen fixation/metabolism regulation signal transduction histidine kinase